MALATTALPATRFPRSSDLDSRPSANGPSWRRLAIQVLAALAVASKQMSFLEHLDELRRRLIWSVSCVAVAFAGCWYFAPTLVAIASAPLLANPAVSLISSRAQDVFSLQVKVCTVAALFVSSPCLLLQSWVCVAPGLYRHERRYAVPVVLAATLMFVLGGAFGYFIAFPYALEFLITWTLEMDLVPNINASEYFDLFSPRGYAIGVNVVLYALTH